MLFVVCVGWGGGGRGFCGQALCKTILVIFFFFFFL